MNLFLSYTSRDREKLRPLLDGLHRLRHTVWFDQELEGGQQWWEAILERIRQADAFLLAVSPAFIESEACGLELEYARALSKPVLPVMVERARPELLPPSLAAVQIVDFCEPDGQAAFTLTSALAHLAPAPPLPEPLPEPPAVPISYLSGLSQRIQSPTLSLDEQLSIVGKLRVGLTRPGEREAVVELIRRFKGREDIYQLVAQDLATMAPPSDDRKASTGPAEQGFYADPLRVHQERFWSGSEWTGRVRDRGIEVYDPIQGSTSPPRSNRSWWIAVPIAFALLVIVIIVILIAAAQSPASPSPYAGPGISNAKIVPNSGGTQLTFDYRASSTCHRLTFRYRFFDGSGTEVGAFGGITEQSVVAGQTTHYTVTPTSGTGVPASATRFTVESTCHD